MTTTDAPKTKEELTKNLRVMSVMFGLLILTMIGWSAYFYFVFEDAKLAVTFLIMVCAESATAYWMLNGLRKKIALTPSSPSQSSHTTPQTQSY
ncbi:MAG: hypothetical protein EAY65_05685 [Alphaproteobacteria bacterium]|nr:MAG: hypothetical protein EAY65_05685 [Alphaproteobacteria bacterium]